MKHNTQYTSDIKYFIKKSINVFISTYKITIFTKIRKLQYIQSQILILHEQTVNRHNLTKFSI